VSTGASTRAVSIPPNDVPAPRLPTARGALRRSLLIWGWGQLVTGDRRGWLLLPLEPLAVVAVGVLGASFAAGEAVGWVFLAGFAVLALWAGQAIHAYRRAVSRRIPFGLSGGDGGAIELLWLAPVAIVAATGFWSIAGQSASPESTLARYVSDWAAGRSSDAAMLFASASDAEAIAGAWGREQPRLRNALVVAVAAAGSNSGIDPASPFDAVRWEADPPAGDRSVVVHARIVRRDTIRDSFLGLVPTTIQRLVPIAELGTVTLAPVSTAGPIAGSPTVSTWRIRAVNMLGETLTAPAG
jgi:hypothetical protein